MQNRMDELMKLSAFELQKRAVAGLIAIIEDTDVTAKIVEEAIETLPEALNQLNIAAEYYNAVYDEVYDEAVEDFLEDLEEIGLCACDDDCDECECEECECEGESCCCFREVKEINNSFCPHGECLCKEPCEECHREEDECIGYECDSYAVPCEEGEEDGYSDEKPEFCKCDKTCVGCEEKQKGCMGLDCPNCQNPRECDE
ncbi:MAG: hypothetical protein E7311_02345 [Clostridiales bacterium]|nr:hypothetical protein [Clostridiales bacterium]